MELGFCICNDVPMTFRCTPLPLLLRLLRVSLCEAVLRRKREGNPTALSALTHTHIHTQSLCHSMFHESQHISLEIAAAFQMHSSDSLTAPLLRPPSQLPLLRAIRAPCLVHLPEITCHQHD